MGAHKRGDGQKASNRPKGKAPCRADTRGGSWAGIPKCLIDSAAYRDLSLHARAVLVEIVARMNGHNNGEINVSQRELVEALGCSPNSIVTAIADLMEHGLLDVTVDGQWRQRQARQYRLTFVSTATAAATNEYLRWTPTEAKSGAIAVIARSAQSATTAIAEPRKPDTTAIARMAAARGKAPVEPAIAVIPPIVKPCPPAPHGERKGDQGLSTGPLKSAAPRFVSETDEHRCCEHCGIEFELGRADRAHVRRFCSEPCRKKAERARAYRRSKGDDEAAPIGKLLNGHLSRLMATPGVMQ